ncbi:MAG: P1 family peptidase [Oscillochloris sp.]|nr:P1 family peptidase [Oscillochloris sp.]
MMTPAITDVSGILIGHAENSEVLTGVTVALCPQGAVGGVDVRGGAPGTRETDLLNPVNAVQEVHAVALCGGSAMGLAAVSGVAQWLYEQGHGFDVGFTRVPIVPAAVIFDLSVGAPVWPDAALGYAACMAAGAVTAEGCVGVGIGASVGKILGSTWAMKGGVGSWSEVLADGTTVGALVVVNAWGDIWEEHGAIIAGARAEGGGFADTTRLLRDPALLLSFRGDRRADRHVDAGEPVPGFQAARLAGRARPSRRARGAGRRRPTPQASAPGAGRPPGSSPRGMCRDVPRHIRRVRTDEASLAR